MDTLDPYSNTIDSTSDESEHGSESSDNGGLTDEQIESTIRLLSQVVEASPNDYQSRVQLIGLLRQHGDLETATTHRETLATLFPLGEST
jgi:protein involved in temperature-dependent protein secretion